MAIIKRVMRVDFEVVLRSTMQDKSISLDTKGLLFFLLSLPSSWEVYVWWLKRELKIGDDKIKRMLKELVSARYIIRRRINSGRGKFDWEMEVYPEPQLTMAGLPSDGSTTNGAAINGQSHDKDNTESVDNTELENTQPQQPAAEVAVGSGCHLIFDKEINQNIHQKLTILLANVDLTLAQQMLDVLAVMGDQARHPLKLIKNFVANQADFDPTPGHKIATAREKKKASEATYQFATPIFKRDPESAAKGEEMIQNARKNRLRNT